MQKQDKSIHILFCSRLVLEKGVDILIEVIKKTVSDSRYENIIWHISSDGEFVDDIKDLSFHFEGRVIYHGKLSQNRLGEIMRKVDFLYMPSRFLETFGLTALESLASGTPVIGIKKGGLIDFIDDSLLIDESNPVESTLNLLYALLQNPNQTFPISVEAFNRDHWRKRFESYFSPGVSLFLLHDYGEKIGGAEAYIEFLSKYLTDIGYTIFRGNYMGTATPLKRRLMFIFSIFAVWRGIYVYNLLEKSKPQHIWMHSVLRYFGYWGVRAVGKYCQKYHHVLVSMSHHDVGYIAPFPQLIYSEDQIPKSSSKIDFLKHLQGWWFFVGYGKWLYIQAIRSAMPKNIRHILFSSFLEKHIKNHFLGDEVLILPHTFDEDIFYRKSNQ